MKGVNEFVNSIENSAEFGNLPVVYFFGENESKRMGSKPQATDPSRARQLSVN